MNTNIDQERQLAAARHDPDVAAWLDTYLRSPRPVWDWTETEGPGWTLLSAALVDCFDLLPELFTPIGGLLASVSPTTAAADRRERGGDVDTASAP